MSVEQTYSWLGKAASIDDLALYIVPLFSGVEKKNWKGILGHLQHYGMFKNIKEGIQTASKLKEKGFYEHIQKEEQYLKTNGKVLMYQLSRCRLMNETREFV